MTVISRRPIWAPSVWKNAKGEIFAQFEDGHVLRFSVFEGGLTKLLKLIPAVEAQPGFVSGASNFGKVTRKKIRVAKKTAERRETLKASDEQRRAADAIIKGMKTK